MPARLEDLRPEDEAQLDRIMQMDDTLAQARELTQGFLDLIRHQRGEGLDNWLKDARASTVRQFHTFAQSHERDKPAILVGLTLPYSTGPVEGHINRLKRDLSASVWSSRASLLATSLLAYCLTDLVSLVAQGSWPMGSHRPILAPVLKRRGSS